MNYNKDLKIQKLIVYEKTYSKVFLDYLNSFVSACHWECTLQDPETLIEVKFYGTSHFPLPTTNDEGSFLSYESLTKSQILSWLESDATYMWKLGEAEDSLTDKINLANKSPEILTQSPIVDFNNIPD